MDIKKLGSEQEQENIRHWFEVVSLDGEGDLQSDEWGIIEDEHGDFIALIDSDGVPHNENNHFKYGKLFKDLCQVVETERNLGNEES